MVFKQKVTGYVTKRPKVVRIAVVVLIALIGLVALYFVKYHKPVKQSLITAAEATKNKNYNQATSELKGAQSSASTNQEKYNVNIRLATNYQHQGDNKNALKYYQEAAKYTDSNNVDVYLGIANTAKATGDKQLAIDNYNKAIGIYQKKVMFGKPENIQSLITYLQQQVTLLKQQ